MYLMPVNLDISRKCQHRKSYYIYIRILSHFENDLMGLHFMSYGRSEAGCLPFHAFMLECTFLANLCFIINSVQILTKCH